MTEDNNNAWQRLQAVLKETGMNISTFSRHIGMKSPTLLYDIRKGKKEISKSLAKTINAHFPEFSVAWLYFGDGVHPPVKMDSFRYMYHNDIVKRIPVFLTIGKDSIPSHFINLSENYAHDSDAAFWNTQSIGMAPLIVRGSLVLLKSNPGQLVIGKPYLFVTEWGVVIRKFGKSDEENYHLYVNEPEEELDVKLPREDIIQIYSVVGVMNHT